MIVPGLASSALEAFATDDKVFHFQPERRKEKKEKKKIKFIFGFIFIFFIL